MIQENDNKYQVIVYWKTEIGERGKTTFPKKHGESIQDTVIRAVTDTGLKGRKVTDYDVYMVCKRYVKLDIKPIQKTQMQMQF